ncbi:MAG: radical SAM protein [Candidatus Pacearchaeota archaeon]|nr:radical SAM protein [Candidatus Pacearchaeota archaeon]
MRQLRDYLLILEGKKLPKFKLARSRGILKRKINQAKKILESCELCERKCHVNRYKEEGWCRVKDKLLVSSYFTHYGEEYFFVPSFTVFFWSCTFSCQFCQNWSISHRFEEPQTMKPKELASIIDEHNYCKNINFVGGEPTPYLPFILETLRYVKSNIPIIWNSNFFMSLKSMKILKGIIDVYLSDFKYGNDECAKRLSKVDNYTAIIKRNHLLAAKNAELVIRHLILPGHVECCSKPILDWIAKNIKDKCIVNLMDQYRPEFYAYKFKELNRTINISEFEKVLGYAKELNLNFIF